jgi:hypothetical protein
VAARVLQETRHMANARRISQERLYLLVQSTEGPEADSCVRQASLRYIADARRNCQQRLAIVLQSMKEPEATQQPKLSGNECVELCQLYSSIAHFVKECSGKFLHAAQVEVDRSTKPNEIKSKTPNPQMVI